MGTKQSFEILDSETGNRYSLETETDILPSNFIIVLPTEEGKLALVKDVEALSAKLTRGDISVENANKLGNKLATDYALNDLSNVTLSPEIINSLSGADGYTGSQGIQGYTGYTGSQGLTGLKGDTGSKGIIGYTGSQGIQGIQGYTGSAGVTGGIGYTGSQGAVGPQGITGYNGSVGGIGYTGSKGADGIQGIDGREGTQGETGYTGSQGLTGLKGDTGYTGSTGVTGLKGDTGYTGSIGYTGSQGIQGYTGSKGDTGSGFRITAIFNSLAELLAGTTTEETFAIVAGTLSPDDDDYGKLYHYKNSTWTYITDMSVKGAAGITGPQGSIGYTGSQGIIGYTGSQGSQGIQGYTGSAGVTGGIGYTGSKGDTGSQGIQGNIGYTGSKGDVGVLETSYNLASSNALNLNLGNLFTKTLTANTTFSVSNLKASPSTNSFIMELTNGGNFVITWWSGIKWSGGIAPVLTSNGVDILGFYSYDNGTTWRGMVLSKDTK